MEDNQNTAPSGAIEENEAGRFEPLELDLDSLEGFRQEEGPEEGPEGGEGTGRAPQVSAFASYVSERLGSDTVKINVGDQSLVRNVSELSDAQLRRLLDYAGQNDTPVPEITEEEMALVEGLRQGGWEFIRQQLEQVAPDEVSDDQLVAQYLFQGLEEDVTEEEVREAVENFKAEPLYEKRIKNLRGQYEQFQEQQKQRSFQERVQQEAQAYRQLGERILEEGFMDFEFDGDEGRQTVGTAFNWLTQPGEGGQTVFDEHLSRPQGKFEAAMALAALPRLRDYVAQLHDELDSLKNSGRRATVIKQQPERAEMDDLDKMFPDLSMRPSD